MILRINSDYFLKKYAVVQKELTALSLTCGKPHQVTAAHSRNRADL
jgi:hypothetical protein